MMCAAVGLFCVMRALIGLVICVTVKCDIFTERPYQLHVKTGWGCKFDCSVLCG